MLFAHTHFNERCISAVCSCNEAQANQTSLKVKSHVIHRSIYQNQNQAIDILLTVNQEIKMQQKQTTNLWDF